MRVSLETNVQSYVITPEKGDLVQDPIEVHVCNSKPCEGSITITCYRSSWSAWWGAMGDSTPTVEAFFASCNVDYLVDNLIRGTPMADREVIDGDERDQWVLDELHRQEEPNQDAIKHVEDYGVCTEGIEDIQNALGHDWWSRLPLKYDDRYERLSNIVATVQEAFRNLPRKPKTVCYIPISDLSDDQKAIDELACLVSQSDISFGASEQELTLVKPKTLIDMIGEEDYPGALAKTMRDLSLQIALCEQDCLVAVDQ